LGRMKSFVSVLRANSITEFIDSCLL
jgi:hypothetical protein